MQYWFNKVFWYRSERALATEALAEWVVVLW